MVATSVINNANDALTAARFKLASSQIFLQDMTADLFPKDDSRMRAIYAATGVTRSNPWQEKFYAHLDAFLVALNSMPDIITSWCGYDQSGAMKTFFSSLSAPELNRRKQFNQAFAPFKEQFVKLELREFRNITVHRSGTPPVQVEVMGRFGIKYVGGPTEAIPTSESPHIVAGDDPALQFAAATQLPVSIDPNWNDFHLVTKSGNLPMLPELKKYMSAAEQLIAEAGKIYQGVHKNDPITPPPAI